MPSGTLIIRPMRRNEIALAVEWAATEGWNPGLDDAETFYAADTEGFLVEELAGEPIAVISAVRYGSRFGFIGFYIVKPEYRGKGYGIRLWQAAMKRLEGRTIGLDGVVMQQENYKKSGFVLACRNIRFAFKTPQPTPLPECVVPANSLAFEALCAYDADLFPEKRDRFLRAWIDAPHATALAILHKGKLAGYGVVRRCRSGHKIGPLFADDPALAETLFKALCSSVGEGETLYLDPPETNKAALELAKRHAMEIVFETARMYAGKAPDLPLDQLFGVTSFELG